MNAFASLRPLLVLADAGIPMLFVTWPAMVIALVPVIAMEALLIRKRVVYKPWPIFRATAAANLVSTIIGIPLTWLALVACEMLIGPALSRIPGIQNWHGPVARTIGFVFAAAWLGWGPRPVPQNLKHRQECLCHKNRTSLKPTPIWDALG